MTVKIKTRKLPATGANGARMRATSDKGHELVIAYPFGSNDPHHAVAAMLARAIGWVGWETALTKPDERSNVWVLKAARTDEELTR